jgi:hypothetical protein
MLEHDYQLSRRALSWTHGFGRKDRPFGSSEVDFIIDLAGGAQLDEESVGRTKEAEDRAGWPPSVYWYVGTVDVSFGETVIGEWNPPLSVDLTDDSEGSAAPFDTGAFAVDPPKVSVSPKDQLDYVHGHLISLAAWHGAVRERLSSCYATFASYVYHDAPTTPMSELNHTHLTDDPRAWTWEARVAKRRCADIARQPDHLYWRSEERRRIVETRLDDRFDALPSAFLARAQEVIAARSSVSSTADHRTDLQRDLVLRAQHTP